MLSRKKRKCELLLKEIFKKRNICCWFSTQKLHDSLCGGRRYHPDCSQCQILLYLKKPLNLRPAVLLHQNFWPAVPIRPRLRQYPLPVPRRSTDGGRTTVNAKIHTLNTSFPKESHPIMAGSAVTLTSNDEA